MQELEQKNTDFLKKYNNFLSIASNYKDKEEYNNIISSKKRRRIENNVVQNLNIIPLSNDSVFVGQIINDERYGPGLDIDKLGQVARYCDNWTKDKMNGFGIFETQKANSEVFKCIKNFQNDNAEFDKNDIFVYGSGAEQIIFTLPGMKVIKNSEAVQDIIGGVNAKYNLNLIAIDDSDGNDEVPSVKNNINSDKIFDNLKPNSHIDACVVFREHTAIVRFHKLNDNTWNIKIVDGGHLLEPKYCIAQNLDEDNRRFKEDDIDAWHDMFKKLLKTENVDFTHTAVNIFIKDSKGKVPQKNCEIKPYTKADRVSTGNMSEGLTTDDCLAAALTAYVNKHDELFQFSEKEPNNTDANNFHSIDVKIQNFMPAGLYFQPQQQKHTHRAR